MTILRHGLFAVAELLLRASISPRLRAKALAALGATVGRNVRVGECQFVNLRSGFSNLVLGDDVFIGGGCLIDLEGEVSIGCGSTVSPRVTLISHADAGSAHRSVLTNVFQPEARGIRVGSECWIGASATVLSGSVTGDRTVVGAASLVRAVLESSSIYVGVPARLLRRIEQDEFL